MKTFALGFCGALAALLLMALMGFQEARLDLRVLPKIYINNHQIPMNERIDIVSTDGLRVNCDEYTDTTKTPETKSTSCWLAYLPSPEDAHRLQKQAEQYQGSEK